MPKKIQKPYSSTPDIHNAIREIAWQERQTISETIESALMALVAQRIAQKKPISVEVLNLYLNAAGVQVVVAQ